MKINKTEWYYKILSGLKKVSIVLLICVSIKILLFDVFYVPSGSMENTLYAGDYIIVDKISVGSRMPKNLGEVPWLNFFYYIFKKEKDSVITFDKNYRLPNISKIKCGDILVFNPPFDQSDYFVKRCIAAPKDTLYIDDTTIWINNQNIDTFYNAKYSYEICFTPQANYNEIFKGLGIAYNEDWYNRKQPCKQVVLTKQQAQQLRINQSVVKVNRVIDTLNNDSSNTYQFKKIIIPFKGMNIELDSSTFSFYRTIIEKYEKFPLKIRNGKFVNDKKEMVTRFEFKHNYYFMMGDNRNSSLDSRAWGFVPDFCIVGKARLIVFSFIDSKVQWKRILKAIH